MKMKEKVAHLIKSSLSLKEEQKQLYLALIKVLDESDIAKLIKIFETEAEEAKKIEENSAKKKSVIYKDFLSKIDIVFEEKEKEAKAAEVVAEEKKGEALLEKLKEIDD